MKVALLSALDPLEQTTHPGLSSTIRPLPPSNEERATFGRARTRSNSTCFGTNDVLQTLRSVRRL